MFKILCWFLLVRYIHIHNETFDRRKQKHNKIVVRSTHIMSEINNWKCSKNPIFKEKNIYVYA